MWSMTSQNSRILWSGLHRRHQSGQSEVELQAWVVQGIRANLMDITQDIDLRHIAVTSIASTIGLGSVPSSIVLQSLDSLLIEIERTIAMATHKYDEINGCKFTGEAWMQGRQLYAGVDFVRSVLCVACGGLAASADPSSISSLSRCQHTIGTLLRLDAGLWAAAKHSKSGMAVARWLHPTCASDAPPRAEEAGHGAGLEDEVIVIDSDTESVASIQSRQPRAAAQCPTTTNPVVLRDFHAAFKVSLGLWLSKAPPTTENTTSSRSFCSSEWIADAMVNSCIRNLTVQNSDCFQTDRDETQNLGEALYKRWETPILQECASFIGRAAVRDEKLLTPALEHKMPCAPAPDTLQPHAQSIRDDVLHALRHCLRQQLAPSSDAAERLSSNAVLVRVYDLIVLLLFPTLDGGMQDERGGDGYYAAIKSVLPEPPYHAEVIHRLGELIQVWLDRLGRDPRIVLRQNKRLLGDLRIAAAHGPTAVGLAKEYSQMVDASIASATEGRTIADGNPVQVAGQEAGLPNTIEDWPDAFLTASGAARVKIAVLIPDAAHVGQFVVQRGWLTDTSAQALQGLLQDVRTTDANDQTMQRALVAKMRELRLFQRSLFERTVLPALTTPLVWTFQDNDSSAHDAVPTPFARMRTTTDARLAILRCATGTGMVSDAMVSFVRLKAMVALQAVSGPDGSAAGSSSTTTAAEALTTQYDPSNAVHDVLSRIEDAVSRTPASAIVDSFGVASLLVQPASKGDSSGAAGTNSDSEYSSDTDSAEGNNAVILAWDQLVLLQSSVAAFQAWMQSDNQVLSNQLTTLDHFVAAVGTALRTTYSTHVSGMHTELAWLNAPIHGWIDATVARIQHNREVLRLLVTRALELAVLQAARITPWAHAAALRILVAIASLDWPHRGNNAVLSLSESLIVQLRLASCCCRDVGISQEALGDMALQSVVQSWESAKAAYTAIGSSSQVILASPMAIWRAWLEAIGAAGAPPRPAPLGITALQGWHAILRTAVDRSTDTRFRHTSYRLLEDGDAVWRATGVLVSSYIVQPASALATPVAGSLQACLNDWQQSFIENRRARIPLIKFCETNAPRGTNNANLLSLLSQLVDEVPGTGTNADTTSLWACVLCRLRSNPSATDVGGVLRQTKDWLRRFADFGCYELELYEAFPSFSSSGLDGESGLWDRAHARLRSVVRDIVALPLTAVNDTAVSQALCLWSMTNAWLEVAVSPLDLEGRDPRIGRFGFREREFDCAQLSSIFQMSVACVYELLSVRTEPALEQTSLTSMEAFALLLGSLRITAEPLIVQQLCDGVRHKLVQRCEARQLPAPAPTSTLHRQLTGLTALLCTSSSHSHDSGAPGDAWAGLCGWPASAGSGQCPAEATQGVVELAELAAGNPQPALIATLIQCCESHERNDGPVALPIAVVTHAIATSTERRWSADDSLRFIDRRTCIPSPNKGWMATWMAIRDVAEGCVAYQNRLQTQAEASTTLLETRATVYLGRLHQEVLRTARYWATQAEHTRRPLSMNNLVRYNSAIQRWECHEIDPDV